MAKKKAKIFLKRDEGIALRERINIQLADGQSYHSMVQDILQDKLILTSLPVRQGIPFVPAVGDTCQIVFFREHGCFSQKAQMEELVKEKKLHLLKLRLLNEPQRNQQRNFYRLEASLDADIRLFGDGSYPPNSTYREEDMPPWQEALTNNLSETGVSLVCANNYDRGACVHIRLLLGADEKQQRVELLGIVRQQQQIELMGKTYYRLGIEFLPCPKSISREIARFILKRQQHILKLRREELDR